MNKFKKLDGMNQKEAVEYLKKYKLWNLCQFRMDGRIEYVCKHGIGHTIWAPKEMGESRYSHGCDGCCSIFTLNETKEERKVYKD